MSDYLQPFGPWKKHMQYDPKKAEKAINQLLSMASEPQQPPYDPEQERRLGDIMLDGLAKELEDRDAERKKLWGDKFPPRLNAKPPDGFVPSTTPTNRVIGGITGAAVIPINRGVGRRRREALGNKKGK